MERRRLAGMAAGVVLLAVAAFLLISLATHDPREGPFPDFSATAAEGNACGVAGAYVSAYALALIGWAAYPLGAALAGAGVLLLGGRKVTDLPLKLSGMASLTVAAVLALAVLNGDESAPGRSYVPKGGTAGGAFGILLARVLYRSVGSTGTVILILMLGGVGLILLAGTELVFLSKLVARAIAQAARWVTGAGRRAAQKPVPAEPEPGPALPDPEPELVRSNFLERHEQVEEEVPDETEEEPEPAEPPVVTTYAAFTDDLDEGGEEFDVSEKVAVEADYSVPPITLLDQPDPSFSGEDETEIREKGNLLQQTLQDFGIDARVVRIQPGPVITMYELSLAAGTKVSRVESLADDLAIALRALNVRIVAPLPGKNTVGIEVPNPERELVGLRELMESTRNEYSEYEIPLFLGKDTAGNPLVLDLATCPHLLVAGATGSGKSVAINAMISSILMTRTPEGVELFLIDPKSVEFTQYSQIPHLLCPVLTDMNKAASVLKWACKKMDERYSLLSQAGVRNLPAYNELGPEEIARRLDPDGDADLEDVPLHMPHIVIIVDEFGELMMVAAKEVEKSVTRLSQKARAVGIHLICATQRPSTDVITGLIKANLPARIAFHVSSMVDSRTILDRNGAELLLGEGDMLLLPPGTSRLVRAQGAYVSDEETQRLVDFLESQSEPTFRAELQKYHAQQQEAEEVDELFNDAVRVVLESQRGSVSLLQRRLSIGYSRAARLIDTMAEAGIVGQHRGSQPRRVLMTLDQWDESRASA